MNSGMPLGLARACSFYSLLVSRRCIDRLDGQRAAGAALQPAGITPGELAFATLVARHGPMVLNVCRRMLRDPADSEDAFQATFLVLVRKRAAIQFETSLGPWLFGVSVRVARRARYVAARRSAFDRSPTMCRPSPLLSEGWPRILTSDSRSMSFWPIYRQNTAPRLSCVISKGLTHEEEGRRPTPMPGPARSAAASHAAAPC